MIHKNITVNQDDDLKHVRSYLKLKGKRYGMSDEEIDNKITYSDETKKVSIDGMDINYPYVNNDSKAYFKKDDLDKAWNEYVELSGKTLDPKKRYEENADYISKEYKKLNENLNSDPFSTDYALSIYKRYTDVSKNKASDIINQGRITNDGSVDTTALADAKRHEMDVKNQAYEKIADYTLKKADSGLKILESFSKENQSGFDNIQTEKINTSKIAKEKAEITGEIPDEVKPKNPYINPETGNVYDVKMDYQEEINQVKDELKNSKDDAQKDILIKKYNNLVDARYAKIVNNPDYLQYIDEGDLVSDYRTLDNTKDLRKNETDKEKAVIDADTEKYKSDNSLKSDRYSADIKAQTDMYLSDNNLESDKYKSDKDAEAKKYDSLNELKEKALDTMMKKEELDEKVAERKSKEDKENQKRAGGNTFGYPVNPSSYTVTSEFGLRNTGIDGASTDHKAIDLACKYGENVLSSNDGVVVFAGWIDGYGNTVEIKHADNIVTKYHHMAETPKVKKGDIVTKGQTIGKVGSTGISSGNHLDFQIFESGVAVDPSKYIDF